MPSRHDLTSLSSRSVVVTGVGTTNPLGGDVASTWAALREGRCAVAPLTQPWAEECAVPVHVAAPLACAPDTILSPKQLRRLDRASQCALLAAQEAWRQAFELPLAWQHSEDFSAASFTSATAAPVDPQRLAVSLSPGMGPVLSVMETWDTLRERGARRVLPTSIPALMPNAPAATVGIEVGARGGIHSPVSACASGAEAIAYGADLIATGRADVVITGGTDAAVHPMTVAAFAAMRALSTRQDTTASRPFAQDRDGFVLGEGAGVLVLESVEHATARDAHILAVLAGTAVTADAYDVARPEPTGSEQERAVRLALERGGLATSQVGHVNAHATSTPVGDRVEAQMLARAVPTAAVSATKSATGHLLGGAGGLEAVLTVMAMVEQWAPPTLQPGPLDPAIADLIDIVAPSGRELPGLEAAVSTSFGFGGHNVALAFC